MPPWDGMEETLFADPDDFCFPPNNIAIQLVLVEMDRSDWIVFCARMSFLYPAWFTYPYGAGLDFKVCAYTPFFKCWILSGDLLVEFFLVGWLFQDTYLCSLVKAS